MSNETGIAERFARDVAQHEMTILRDDGLYRHLRFVHVAVNEKTGKRERSSFYWFDLITWPGSLAVNGDMDSFLFSRTEDMFEFFRGGNRYGINPQYWGEKVQAGRESLRRYDEDVLRQVVFEHFSDAVRHGDTPTGLARAVREEIYENGEIYCEHDARIALSEFEHEGFRFHDTWEWDLQDWSHQFLWCCHAIQWGIRQYDEAREAARRQAETAGLSA